MSTPGDPPPEEVSTASNPPSTPGQAKRFSRITTSSTAMSTRLATQTEELVQTSTPATSVGTALTSLSDEFNPRVHRGIKVLKVTSHGKTKPRVVTISNDKFTVFVTPAKVKSVKQNQRDNTSGRLVNVTRQVLPSAPTFSRKGIGFKSGVRDKYIRSIDVADINWVQVGYVGTKKLELGNTKSKRNVTKHSAGIVSIVHHGKETLDVLFANEEHAQSFVTALNSVLNTYHASKVHVGREELLLRYIWYDVDLNQNGLIDKKELHKILCRINAYVKSATANKKYNEYLKMNTTTGPLRKAQGITYHQAMSLLEEIKREQNKDGKLMSDIIWDDLFGHSKSMVGPSEFLTKFLHETQHEMDATINDVETVFTHLNAMEIARGVLVQKTITGDGSEEDPQVDYHASIDRIRFEAYLNSNMNDCYDPDAQELDTSTLTDPISYYWINTSHNTYLTGDQLRSASAVSMYNEALHRGCKCLELDCWDGEKAKNGKQPEPVVFHGHTMTSKIKFADIIDCVNSYVNANPNTYPIILSLENHCSHPFQKVMARVLKETLGTKLFIFNGRKSGLSVDGKLPSPEALRGMVVIKGKRPPDPDEEEEEEEEEEEKDEEDPYEMEGSATKVKDQKKPKIVPELAELTLFHGTKYKSFTTSMNAPPSHMHSIGETKITKILSKDPNNATLWRQYNVDHMTRTYPAGSRVDSSNYNPMVAWAMGSQLVALNFQSSDHCLLLNDGRFRQNGGCGYVKKPNSVMEREDEEEGVRGPVRLKVRVLSGSCLPKPNGDKGGEVVDPYVKVTLHDVKESDGSGGNVGDASFDERGGGGKKEENSIRDGIKGEIKSVMTDNTTRERLVEHKHQTKVVDDNGFCPVWYETKFKEFTVHNPEVAMVLFSLRESDLGMFNDDKIADAAIPVSCLRRGYRSVQLYDTSSGSRWGPFDFATLLVEIDMEDVEVV